MSSEEEEEEEVDPKTQELRWKIEAIIVRVMKEAKAMGHQQLVAVTLQQWQALQRPEPIGQAFVEERIEALKKQEWFAAQGDGRYHLTDLSEK